MPAAAISLLLSCFGCDQEVSSAHESATWVPVSNPVCLEQWREEDALRYCSAQVDLDGDKIPDQAQLVTGAGGRIGVAVRLTSRGGEDPLVVFTTREIPVQLQTGAGLGVRRMPPGTYETLCGKGLATCSDTDPREVHIANDAILLFKDDAWGDLVYLGSDRTLKLVAHSD